MELMAFKNCLENLLASGLLRETFISVRYSLITKYMHDNIEHVKHYFDL